MLNTAFALFPERRHRFCSLQSSRVSVWYLLLESWAARRAGGPAWPMSGHGVPGAGLRLLPRPAGWGLSLQGWVLGPGGGGSQWLSTGVQRVAGRGAGVLPVGRPLSCPRRPHGRLSGPKPWCAVVVGSRPVNPGAAEFTPPTRRLSGGDTRTVPVPPCQLPPTLLHQSGRYTMALLRRWVWAALCRS